MKILRSLCLILTFASSSAFAADACFQQEINPETKQVFASIEEYNRALIEWENFEPANPGLFALAKAYALYNSEKKNLDKITNDKRAHCYMGCRISQESDYQVSEYVAWLKENRDLKDCNKTSHFEAADFDATVKGAQIGQSQVDAAGCLAVCSQNY